MKDDYLWDKTGEPDPEIEHMERVLGALRHRRKSHDLPAFELRPVRKAQRFPKMLALAAALAFATLALGIAAALMRQSAQKATENRPIVMASPVSPDETLSPPDAPAKERAAESLKPQESRLSLKSSEKRAQARPLVARRRSSTKTRDTYMSERTEGMMAKERLIKALQITTSKLDFVRRQVKEDPKRGPSS